jgi:hypothetical protein
MNTPERPLDQVLSRRSFADFEPQRPGRAPWRQPTLDHVELAYTGNTHVVPLVIADRVHLHGVGLPTWEQDDLEPGDWHPITWGVSPSSKLRRER